MRIVKKVQTVWTNDPYCKECEGWGILVDKEGDEYSCSCGEATEVEVEVDLDQEHGIPF